MPSYMYTHMTYALVYTSASTQTHIEIGFGENPRHYSFIGFCSDSVFVVYFGFNSDSIKNLG